MKSFKKIAVLAALLLACSFGFSQEAETSKNLSKIKGMYAGMQMGGGVLPDGFALTSNGSVGCFEMTPYFGMYLSDNLPDLALEFDIQMNFTSQSFNGITAKLNIISPQVLLAYTFDIGKLNPFMKAGLSLNLINGSLGSQDIVAKPSISFVLNPGVSYKINDKTVLSLFCRFNLNDFQKFDKPSFKYDIPLKTRSLGMGLDIHF